VEPGANPERRASASNRLDRLGAFLAFALAHAPAEAKPALLKRWQDLEARRVSFVTAARLLPEEGELKTRKGPFRDTEKHAFDATRALLARACSERVANDAASKPRSRVRALAEGAERGLAIFPALLRNMAETVTEHGGEVDADAARAASYALGARGAPLADAFASAVARDVAARAFKDGLSSVPKASSDPQAEGELPPLPKEANLPLGALLLLESSKGVTATVDALIAHGQKTKNDERESSDWDAAMTKTSLALGARAHALRLVDPADPAARSAALAGDVKGGSRAGVLADAESSRAFEQSASRLRLVSDAEWLATVLFGSEGASFGEQAGKDEDENKNALVAAFVADPAARAGSVVAAAAAAPRAALRLGRSGALAETRARLFRVAETHGVDLTRVAVAHAAALLAETKTEYPYEKNAANETKASFALDAARDATRDLERVFSVDPEGARSGLIHEAWPALVSSSSA
jgi:hypothetical protein